MYNIGLLNKIQYDLKRQHLEISVTLIIKIIDIDIEYIFWCLAIPSLLVPKESSQYKNNLSKQRIKCNSETCGLLTFIHPLYIYASI